LNFVYTFHATLPWSCHKLEGVLVEGRLLDWRVAAHLDQRLVIVFKWTLSLSRALFVFGAEPVGFV